MLIKRLSNGLSGANIELRKGARTLFIRKIANNTSQSKLLENQASLMRSWDSDFIKMPSILDTGKDNLNNFFIDMDYIEGDSFCHYIANPNILNFKYQWSFVEKLLDHMRHNLDLYSREHKTGDIYLVLTQKLFLLEETLLPLYGNNSKTKDLLNKINQFILLKRPCIEKLRLGPPSNTVHGDLTLSNIIVGKEELFFIDPIEHYLGKSILSDYFKLLFDLDFKLSFRIEKQYEALGTSVIIDISRLIFLLTSLYSREFKVIASVQNIFLSIEALRVLQYSYGNYDLSNALLRYIELKIDDIGS